MSMIFEHRPSDSPAIERVWRSHSEHASSFWSIAATHWEMVVSKYQGQTLLTVRGPETKATIMSYPAGVDFLGIDFKLGTFMPHLPPTCVMNLQDVNLPEAAANAFWLYGAAWEFPTFDNAETFVSRLVREGLLIHDPVVAAVLQDHQPAMSPRSIQYRFQQATGLTHRDIQQIKRARHTAACLKQGMSILDSVYEAGYSDQPHLTRALKRFLGLTPTQILSTPLISLGHSE